MRRACRDLRPGAVDANDAPLSEAVGHGVLDVGDVPPYFLDGEGGGRDGEEGECGAHRGRGGGLQGGRGSAAEGRRAPWRYLSRGRRVYAHFQTRAGEAVSPQILSDKGYHAGYLITPVAHGTIAASAEPHEAIARSPLPSGEISDKIRHHQLMIRSKGASGLLPAISSACVATCPQTISTNIQKCRPPELSSPPLVPPRPRRPPAMGKNVFSVPIFFIVFRETLEAAIIISVLLGLVEQIAHEDDGGSLATAAVSRNEKRDGDNSSGHASGDLDDEPTLESPDDADRRKRLFIRRMRLQIFFGSFLGLFIALAIGAAFIAVWFTKASDLWSKSEELWEGTPPPARLSDNPRSPPPHRHLLAHRGPHDLRHGHHHAQDGPRQG